MHLDIDFFSKVIYKYLFEFLLTLSLIRLLSYFVNSKLFILILWIFNFFKLPFFLSLNHRIINHIYFNTLYLMKLKTYLRYVLNQEYRSSLSILSDDLIQNLHFNSSSDIISRMLFSTQKAFINILVKEIQSLRVSHGDFIRKAASEKRIPIKLAWDYTLYLDFILQFLISRIKDLQHTSSNNYQLYILYLFIMNDTLLIMMEQLPGISRTKFKGTMMANPKS